MNKIEFARSTRRAFNGNYIPGHSKGIGVERNPKFIWKFDFFNLQKGIEKHRNKIGTYAITVKKQGKIVAAYVGQSRTIGKRWEQHANSINRITDDSALAQHSRIQMVHHYAAIAKTDPQYTLEFQVLSLTNPHLLTTMESQFMSEFYKYGMMENEKEFTMLNIRPEGNILSWKETLKRAGYEIPPEASGSISRALELDFVTRTMKAYIKYVEKKEEQPTSVNDLIPSIFPAVFLPPVLYYVIYKNDYNEEGKLTQTGSSRQIKLAKIMGQMVQSVLNPYFLDNYKEENFDMNLAPSQEKNNINGLVSAIMDSRNINLVLQNFNLHAANFNPNSKISLNINVGTNKLAGGKENTNTLFNRSRSLSNPEFRNMSINIQNYLDEMSMATGIEMVMQTEESMREYMKAVANSHTTTTVNLKTISAFFNEDIEKGYNTNASSIYSILISHTGKVLVGDEYMTVKQYNKLLEFAKKQKTKQPKGKTPLKN